MKFWNKDKDTRRTHWTQIDIWPASAGWRDTSEAKRWCQQQPSAGKFYFYYYDVWYFERAEDATMFMLRWA